MEEEEVEGGRGGAGRGLSYSLPVTYYELIPTAPVKYYCKILTVICARERNAGTLRARVCPRQLTRRANELPRRAFAFFVRPSISFRNLFRSPHPGKRRDVTATASSRPTSRIVLSNNNNNHGRSRILNSWREFYFRIFLFFFWRGRNEIGYIRRCWIILQFLISVL